MSTIVKNAKGEIIGMLTTRPSDGVIEARNTLGRLVAHYNPRTNEMRDDRGNLLGRGNRLRQTLG